MVQGSGLEELWKMALFGHVQCLTGLSVNIVTHTNSNTPGTDWKTPDILLRVSGPRSWTEDLTHLLNLPSESA